MTAAPAGELIGGPVIMVSTISISAAIFTMVARVTAVALRRPAIAPSVKINFRETSCNDARYFATAATDQQLNDANAECHLRVEGAQRRVRRVEVRRVAESWPI